MFINECFRGNNIVDAETKMDYNQYMKDKKKDLAGVLIEETEIVKWQDNPKYDRILEQLNNITEYQEQLVALESSAAIKGYSFSETHCIDLIGSLDYPNVTKIAAGLRITRGAVSKMIKRLEAAGLTERFQMESNKKEVYFKLTEKGWEIYRAHKERHLMWMKRDYEFLDTLGPEALETAQKYVDMYTRHLKDKIKKLKSEK